MNNFKRRTIAWVLWIAIMGFLALLLFGCSQQPVYIGVPDTVVPIGTCTVGPVKESIYQNYETERLIDIGNDNMIRSADQMNRNFTHEIDHPFER